MARCPETITTMTRRLLASAARILGLDPVSRAKLNHVTASAALDIGPGAIEALAPIIHGDGWLARDGG